MKSTSLDGLVSLQKALLANGIRAHLWALADACAGETSLKAFARCAEQQGLEASLVQIEPGDLAFLAPPALVAGGAAIELVVGHGPGGAIVERVDGSRYAVGPRSDAHPTAALTIRPAAAASTRLLGRLALRLRAEPHATRATAIAAVLAVVLLAFGLATPILTRALLGSALPERARSTLALLALGVALVGLQTAYLGWLRRRALRYLSTQLSEKASLDVVAHMLRLPFARLRNLDVGAARQAATSAASAAEALPTLAPQAVDAVLGFGYLAYVVSIDPTSGAFAALAGLLVVIVGALAGWSRLGQKRALLAHARAEQQCLYETLAGIETVKCESVEGRMLARWLDRLLPEQAAALRLRLHASTVSTILATLDSLVFGAVLLFMARRCLSGAGDIADVMAAVQASSSFMTSARSLGLVPSLVSNLRGDIERVDEMFSESAEQDARGGRSADPNAPAIVVRNAWFRYDEDAPWVLSGVDLVVQRGESVVLTWPSGAGKSTLLRMLAGLIAPAPGDVLVFGMEATRARRMVAYIPQQATLFPGSLFENLQILSRTPQKARIIAAAEATGLMKLVATWGMGLDTVVSAGGANLSSGQRQLVLLTAAVASEAPIVLLDEALAHMDLSMRRRLGGTGLFRDRTVITVAHDASRGELAGARVVAMHAPAVTAPAFRCA